MKGFSGFGNSPVKKAFDYSKKADYSPEATKGNLGSKIADFITPDISGDNTAWENIKGVTEVIPMNKAAKLAKFAFKYFTGGDDKDKA